MPKLVQTALRWALTICLGFGIGYAAILGHQYWKKLQFQQQMLVAGDYAALLERFKERKAIMVVKDGCPWCEKARVWLRAHDIALQEVDVGDEGLSDIPVAGTPTLFLKDRSVIGFDETVWARELKANSGTIGGP